MPRVFLTFFLIGFMFCVGVNAAPVKAKVHSVKGTVVYAAPGSDAFRPLTRGMLLSRGTTVRTGAGAEAVIVAVPGAAMRIDANSTVVLDEMDFSQIGDVVTKRKARVELRSGTVSALLEKDAPEINDFRIQTAQGVAAARGTFYAVTVEDDKTFVAVREGKVGTRSFRRQ